MTKNKNWTAKRTQNTGASKASLRATNARIDRMNAKIRRIQELLTVLDAVKTLVETERGDVK